MMTETINKIQDGLYVGNLNALYWVSKLPEKEQEKWSVVTILSKPELSNLPFAMPKHIFRGLVISADDSPRVNLSSVFRQVADFIESNLASGKKVLVHCMMGISRSASCVIAYLIIKKGMTLADALSLVRKQRGCVSPNPGFLKQLKELEQNVLGNGRAPSSALLTNWSVPQTMR